jgi:hypothetical protein
MNIVNTRRWKDVVGGRVKSSSWRQLDGAEWKRVDVWTFIQTSCQYLVRIRNFLDVPKISSPLSTRSVPDVPNAIFVFLIPNWTQWHRVIRIRRVTWRPVTPASKVRHGVSFLSYQWSVLSGSGALPRSQLHLRQRYADETELKSDHILYTLLSATIPYFIS